jgi:hypothetical protein
MGAEYSGAADVMRLYFLFNTLRYIPSVLCLNPFRDV